jgi:hypothetical protein
MYNNNNVIIFAIFLLISTGESLKNLHTDVLNDLKNFPKFLVNDLDINKFESKEFLEKFFTNKELGTDNSDQLEPYSQGSFKNNNDYNRINNDLRDEETESHSSLIAGHQYVSGINLIK